jgi:hypothetical protein
MEMISNPNEQTRHAAGAGFPAEERSRSREVQSRCLLRPMAEERPKRGAEALRLTIPIIVVALAAGTVAASARDDGRYANSPLKSWFESLHSKAGGACCADADGVALSEADWDTQGGHYRVRLQGEWIDVPDDTVIKEPNRAGRPMVWPYYLNGRPVVRCFIPGTMT